MNKVQPVFNRSKRQKLKLLQIILKKTENYWYVISFRFGHLVLLQLTNTLMNPKCFIFVINDFLTACSLLQPKYFWKTQYKNWCPNNYTYLVRFESKLIKYSTRCQSLKAFRPQGKFIFHRFLSGNTYMTQKIEFLWMLKSSFGSDYWLLQLFVNCFV